MTKLFLLTLLLMQIHFCISFVPYQVQIKLRLAVNSPNSIQLCNGVIVFERIVLTTADCMQIKIQGSSANHIVNPAMVLIYGGIEPQVVRGVKSIEISPGFNNLTLENDIAVLKLNESLPLGHRRDIQWVMMDDPIVVNQTCAATFTNPSQYVQTPSPTHPIVIEDQRICYRFGNYAPLKRNDICARYLLNPGVMCNATGNDLRYTTDRGTPLMCNNKVVGLLSSVIAPSSTAGYIISCMQLRMFSAYYTHLYPHLTWIYQKISEENQSVNKPIIAPPFNGVVIPPSTTTVTSPPNLKKKNNANVLNSKYALMTSITLYLIIKMLS